LSAETGWTKDAIRGLTAQLISDGTLLKISDEILLAKRAATAATASIMAALDQHLRASAGAGLKRAELKTRTKLNSEIFDFLLEELVREKRLQVRGESVSLYGVEERIPESDRRLLSAIASAYEVAGLASPLPEEVASALAIGMVDMRRLMVHLLRDKTLTKLGQENLYVHQLALKGLRSQIAAFRGQKIEIGQFKRLTGLSRKYAIPLLEYLDREHVTRKEGEHRLVL